MGWLALLLCLLFFCGPIGWGVLFILVLFICVATESWGLLLILLAIPIFLVFTPSLHLGKRVRHKIIKIKKDTKDQKPLEINNETISILVKLVGRMSDDGRDFISPSNTADIIAKQWNLYQDWFRRNADEYVIVSDYTVRVKSKADKIKLINKLLKMKTNEIV